MFDYLLGCGYRVFSEQEHFLITHMTHYMNFIPAITVICNYQSILNKKKKKKHFHNSKEGNNVGFSFGFMFIVMLCTRKVGYIISVVLSDNFSYPMEEAKKIYGGFGKSSSKLNINHFGYTGISRDYC